VRSCLSTARPTTKDVGTQIYETDTLRSRIWDGTYWLETDGPAYTWTAVLASGGTLGNGTVVAKYHLRGWEMSWSIDWTLGSTSVMGTDPKFSTPGTMTIDNNGGLEMQAGSAMCRDAGTKWYNGTVLAYTAGDNVLSTTVIANDLSVTATVPFTWTTGDRIVMQGVYRMDDVDAPTS